MSDLRGFDEPFEEYVERLEDTSGLVWPKQARRILVPFLYPRVTIVDVGCALGYVYDDFADLKPIYTGIEFVPERVEVASNWFADNPDAKFVEHDFVLAPIPVSGEIVLCSATLEHCPALMPGLEHLALATEKALYLRTWLGDTEILAKFPEKALDMPGHQYAFSDVLTYLNHHGFKTRVYQDEYTRSLPYYVQGIVRRFYIVLATK